jgi:hypothetical protein
MDRFYDNMGAINRTLRNNRSLPSPLHGDDELTVDLTVLRLTRTHQTDTYLHELVLLYIAVVGS